MIIFALHLAYMVVREHTYEPSLGVVFASELALFRLAAGIAAIWAGLRGGAIPLLAILGFLLGGELWREIMRRAADSKNPDD